MGLLFLKKLKRIDFQHMSLLLLLKWGHWQAVEKLLKSHVFGRDVERFCEEIDVANLGETNPWGEGDRVKWATCGRGDPYLMFERDILQYSTIFYNILQYSTIFDVWVRLAPSTNVTGGKKSHISIRTSRCSKSGDKCALNETYPCKFPALVFSKCEQPECLKPFHLSYT